jgi:hypothetical protein
VDEKALSNSDVFTIRGVIQGEQSFLDREAEVNVTREEFEDMVNQIAINCYGLDGVEAVTDQGLMGDIVETTVLYYRRVALHPQKNRVPLPTMEYSAF